METAVKNGRRKAFYLMLSILVACGIWLYADVTGGPNGTARTVTREITDIPIEYTDEATLTDRGLMLVDEGTDFTTTLKAEGARWLVSNLDRSKVRVVVSLVDVLNPGIQTVNYRLIYANRTLKDGIINTELSIGNGASVHISELYRRSIPVSCELVGNVAEGCTAKQVELSHEEIEVRGLQEDIDPIASAKVTLDIGENAAETITKELEIQFYDQNGQLLENDGIHATVETIKATLPVLITKELRLVVNFSDVPGARLSSTDWVVEPSTIMVSGDASQLKNVDSLNLGDFNLLDLGTSASSNYTTTYYHVILPDGCQNLSGVTRAALRIRFKDMESVTVPVRDIVLENAPAGKQAELLTTEIPVRIYGTASDVAAVTGSQISARADLGDYASASGTYTIPVEVTIQAQEVGISGTYQVQVSIREAPQEEPEPPAEGDGET